MTKILKTGVSQLKENRFFVIFSLIIVLVAQYMIEYKESIWPKIYILLIMFIIFLLGILLAPNRVDKLARNCFILIFLLGSTNSLILPIRQNLDENTHYFYTLQLADGNLTSQTDEKNFLLVSPDFLAITKLPSKPEYGSPNNTNLYTKEFHQLLNIKSEYKEKYIQKTGFINPAYIPSAIGVKLGQLISNRLFVSYYLGRIFNVLFYALLAFWAIKISKYYQIQLFVMSLLPFVTWIASGYSYDSLYYGLVLLILAQFTNFLGENKSFTFKRGIFYALSCLCLVFCKAPVILLIFLPLFLSRQKFDTIKTYWLNFLSISVVGLLGILWLGQVSIMKFLGHTSSVVAKTSEVSSPTVSRLTYFIEHPIYTAEMVLRSLFDIPATILDTLSRPQPFMPGTQVLSAINMVSFVIILIIISGQLTIEISKKMRYIIIVLFFIISLAIMYAISGDPRVFKVGDLHIAGVQGRYHYYILVFLPLLLAPVIKNKVLFARASSISAENSEKVSVNIVKLVTLLTVVNTCVALYAYF